MKTLVAVASLFAILVQQSINVDVRLQEFTATVRNKQGTIVENLGIKDFVLEENGKKQPIAHFSPDVDTPVSIGLLIDTSGSMAQILPSAVSTAKALVHLMRPHDEFIVMTFDSTLHLEHDFTRDRTAIDQQLSGIKVSAAGTFLFESVLQAADHLRTSEIRKRALLLVTDGFPSTKPDLKQVANAIYEREVLIYTFGLLPTGAGTITVPYTPPVDPKSLPHVGIRNEIDNRRPVAAPVAMNTESLSSRRAKEVWNLLASASGGQSMALDPATLQSEKTAKDLITFVQDMAAELRGQYTVGYYPTDKSATGPKVTIRTLSGNFRVRTRLR
jgi:VWFA-related protein